MLDNIISGIKEREWSFSIPILKVCKYFKDRNKSKPKVDYEWVYDGCGCMPPDNSRSDPYCHEHYNPLVRREIK